LLTFWLNFALMFFSIRDEMLVFIIHLNVVLYPEFCTRIQDALPHSIKSMISTWTADWVQPISFSIFVAQKQWGVLYCRLLTFEVQNSVLLDHFELTHRVINMPKNLKLLFAHTYMVCKAIYNCYSWQPWGGRSKGNAVPLDWRMSNFGVSKDHAVSLCLVGLYQLWGCSLIRCVWYWLNYYHCSKTS
jgi:hypothetical protein